MRLLLLECALVSLSLCWLSLPAGGVQTVAVDGGVFWEAESYDQLLSGQDFAQITAETQASGGNMLIGMFRPGAIRYQLSIPAAGTYALWMRYAAPSDATTHISFGAADESALQPVKVRMTSQKLDAPGAYQWARLGQFDLPAGNTFFVLGQGPLRPDCFLLTPQLEAQVDDAVLEAVARAKEAPRGEKLPELTHSRAITQHPQWLRQAMRPCYAHFEWDPRNTPESWCEKAARAGANCIFGAGEMPAGELDGALKRYDFSNISRMPAFQFPEGYDLSFSWVKRYADAAHAHGLKIVIYDGAYRTLDPILLEHPDWRQMDAEGRPFADGFGSWCSPYRQAWIDRWVKVARESGLDGIMIDMMFTGPNGGDYSPWTVKAFKERFGVEPPREADYRNLTWQRWIDFQSWVREEALLDLTEALHAVNPEIAVIPNQTKGWIFSGVTRTFLSTRAARCADGLLEEMGWDYKHNWNRPWAWPVGAQFQNLFLTCRTRPGYGQMWHMVLNFPQVHTEALAYSMLANGAAPGVVTGGNWPQMEAVWRHIKGCEPWIEEADLTPWMALHFSENTLNWYANARGSDAYMAYMKNVFGLFQAALELHLPVEIITDDDLADPQKLARYATVCLPNSACLSDAQVAALVEYVKGGGGLMATFETGSYDEDGTRRTASALEALTGVRTSGAVASDSWSFPLASATHPMLQHPDIQQAGGWRQGFLDPSPVATLFAGPKERGVSAVAVTRPPEDAFTLPLQGAGTPKAPFAPQDASFKTLIARTVGQGKVVYFPIDLGHAYYVFNHPLNRRLIGQALQWTAATAPPLQTDAPMLLQTVPWQKGSARVVHLLNDISSFGRAAAPNPEAFTAFRSEVIPLHDVTVSVPGTFTEALWLPEGSTLPVTAADGWTKTTVPRVDIHGIVVFR
jgi:hypothetical protein